MIYLARSQIKKRSGMMMMSALLKFTSSEQYENITRWCTWCNNCNACARLFKEQEAETGDEAGRERKTLFPTLFNSFNTVNLHFRLACIRRLPCQQFSIKFSACASFSRFFYYSTRKAVSVHVE